MKYVYGLTMRGIIKNSAGEILILKRHPKSRTDPDMWELPGGKLEAGEYFDEGLVREIKEETNLDCEVGDFAIAIQHDYPHKRTVQLIMYLDDIKGEFKISDEHTEGKYASIDEIEFKISDEHTEGKYASIDEIKTLKLSGCLQKVLEKKNWIL